jgi:uncharacterized protein
VVKLRFLLFCTVMILLGCSLFSDESLNNEPLMKVNDWYFLMEHTENREEKLSRKSFVRASTTNELKLYLELLIQIYQTVISTQDQPSCTFTPSCSQYAKEAVRKHGPLGIIMAAARLQRCHGMSRGYYPIHPETGKYHDPLD